MYRKILLTTLATIAFGSAAARTFEFIEGVHEAVLNQVTLPQSAAGNVVFRECPACEPVVHPVDGNTIYIGSTGEMTLQDFLAEVAAIRATPTGNDTTGAGVFWDLQTNRTTRISLHPGAFAE